MTTSPRASKKKPRLTVVYTPDFETTEEEEEETRTDDASGKKPDADSATGGGAGPQGAPTAEPLQRPSAAQPTLVRPEDSQRNTGVGTDAAGQRADGFSADGTRHFGWAESTAGYGSRASGADFEEDNSPITPHVHESTPGEPGQELWEQ